MLSFTEIIPGKAPALGIRTDGDGLTLINVHGPQAGCSTWAGRAAFWADIQMYATARSLSGRHPLVIAGDTNIYMDATTNPAREHFQAFLEACGLRRAMAGSMEDMTPTLHLSRHRVDTFLVDEPLLPWSLQEAFGPAAWHTPRVIWSDHPRSAWPCRASSTRQGTRRSPPPTATQRAAFSRTAPRPRPSNAACARQSQPRRASPPWCLG